MSWLDSPNQLSDAVEHVKAVKAEGLDVGVDFHGRLHKPMAKQLAKLLESVQPLFIEGKFLPFVFVHYIDELLPRPEPLLLTQSEEFADLAKTTSCPIATGERLFTRHDFRPYFERRAIDIAQPDVTPVPNRFNSSY